MKDRPVGDELLTDGPGDASECSLSFISLSSSSCESQDEEDNAAHCQVLYRLILFVLLGRRNVRKCCSPNADSQVKIIKCLQT